MGGKESRAHSITGNACINCSTRVYHSFSLTPNKHTCVLKRKHARLQRLPAAATYLPAHIHPHPSPPFTSPLWLTAHLTTPTQTHMHMEEKGRPRFKLSSTTMAHVHNQARGLTDCAPPLGHGEREESVWSQGPAVFTAHWARDSCGCSLDLEFPETILVTESNYDDKCVK